MNNNGTRGARKRGRQSDLSAKAARPVKGGAVDRFANFGNIKGETESTTKSLQESVERLKW